MEGNKGYLSFGRYIVMGYWGEYISLAWARAPGLPHLYDLIRAEDV